MKKTNDYNKSLSGAKHILKLYNEGIDFVEEGYFQKLRVSENGEKVYEFLVKARTNFMKFHEKYQTSLIIIEELASPNSDVSNLEYIFIKSQMVKEFVDCIIVELQNKTAFVKSADKEKEIELLKGLIKANNRIIKLSNDKYEKERLEAKNKELENDIKIKEDERDYYYDKSKSKGKWSHLKNNIDELYICGYTKKNAIKQIVEEAKDKMIQKELEKNNHNVNKLVNNIERSFYR